MCLGYLTVKTACMILSSFVWIQYQHGTNRMALLYSYYVISTMCCHA